MNAPEKYTSWRWESIEQEKKLTFIEDTKIPNAGLFILGKEDHTLGNLIRIQLLRDPSVRFAGYRMPHPLTFDCHIKVQTTDSRTTPVNVFLVALNDLSAETRTLEKSFEEALASYELSEGL